MVVACASGTAPGGTTAKKTLRQLYGAVGLQCDDEGDLVEAVVELRQAVEEVGASRDYDKVADWRHELLRVTYAHIGELIDAWHAHEATPGVQLHRQRSQCQIKSGRTCNPAPMQLPLHGPRMWRQWITLTVVLGLSAH